MKRAGIEVRDAQAARPALRALARPAEIPLSYASAGCGLSGRLKRDAREGLSTGGGWGMRRLRVLCCALARPAEIPLSYAERLGIALVHHCAVAETQELSRPRVWQQQPHHYP